jgi:hypothetical protein
VQLPPSLSTVMKPGACSDELRRIIDLYRVAKQVGATLDPNELLHSVLALYFSEAPGNDEFVLVRAPNDLAAVVGAFGHIYGSQFTPLPVPWSDTPVPWSWPEDAKRAKACTHWIAVNPSKTGAYPEFDKVQHFFAGAKWSIALSLKSAIALAKWKEQFDGYIAGLAAYSVEDRKWTESGALFGTIVTGSFMFTTDMPNAAAERGKRARILAKKIYNGKLTALAPIGWQGKPADWLYG